VLIERTNRSNYDEKDDEILDIINEHQKASQTRPHGIDLLQPLEDDKQEEADKDVYAEFFNQAFQNKPTAFEKQQNLLAKNLNNNNLSLKSQPFGDSFHPQQPNNHPQSGVFPPKMPFYNNGPQPFPQKVNKNRSHTATSQQTNFIQINGNQASFTPKHFNTPVENNRFPGTRSPQYNSLNNIPNNNFAPMYQQPMNFQPPEIIHSNFNGNENQGETNFNNGAPEIFINPDTIFGEQREQPSVPESIVDLIERDISVILKLIEKIFIVFSKTWLIFIAPTTLVAWMLTTVLSTANSINSNLIY